MSTEEVTNDSRAGFAAEALATYHMETRAGSVDYGDEGSEQFVETFGDLLGDLQHLARRAGVEFTDLLASGTGHFEYEVAEEEERDRQYDAPLIDRVYGALDETHQGFNSIAERAGITDKKELLDVLKQLRADGKAETYPGFGHRRITVPLDERVHAALAEKYVSIHDIEAKLLVDGTDLRASLLRLQEQGKAEVEYGKGWRRTAATATEEPAAVEPAPKSDSDALREIFVHLALNPGWDSDTFDNIVEIQEQTGLPALGDMQEVEYWITEAQRLGVWWLYEDQVKDWARDHDVKLKVFEEEN